MAGSRGGFGDLFAAEAKLQGAPSAADESGSFWDMMGLEKKSDEEEDLESQSFLDSAKSLWPAQFGGEGGGGGGGAPAQTQEAAVMGLSYQTRFKVPPISVSTPHPPHTRTHRARPRIIHPTRPPPPQPRAPNPARATPPLPSARAS